MLKNTEKYKEQKAVIPTARDYHILISFHTFMSENKSIYKYLNISKLICFSTYIYIQS